MSDTLSVINEEIKAAIERRRKIFEDALDGRTQKWLSEKTGIAEPRISACISGALNFTESELKSINKILKTKF